VFSQILTNTNQVSDIPNIRYIKSLLLMIKSTIRFHIFVFRCIFSIYPEFKRQGFNSYRIRSVKRNYSFTRENPILLIFPQSIPQNIMTDPVALCLYLSQHNNSIKAFVPEILLSSLIIFSSE
jgi:hypothetical protein